MSKDNKKIHKFNDDQMNGSWFKIGGTNFGGPVHRGDGGEFIKFTKNSKTLL